jgi:hypothetical protein
VENGTSGLQDALNNVKDSAAALRADSASALRPAAEQFQTALTAVGTSIENVASEGTDAVRTAVQNAGQSARDLQNQTQSLYHCP